MIKWVSTKIDMSLKLPLWCLNSNLFMLERMQLETVRFLASSTFVHSNILKFSLNFKLAEI